MGVSMESDEKLILRDFKKALVRAWAVNDENNWPIKLNSISHLFLKEFSRDFINNIEELTNQGRTPGDMAQKLGSPTTIFRTMDQVLRGMFMNRIPVQKRREIIISLLKCIKSRKSGSLFNEDGKNLLYSRERIKKLSADSAWRTVNSDSAAIIHQWIGLLKAYVELLFFRMYEISQEIHGQYDDLPGSKNNLIIREFKNLQPLDLWQDMEFLPHNNITIYSQYDTHIRVEFDIYNHMYQKGKNFPPHMVKWLVITDEDKTLDIPAIKNLIALTRDIIFKIQQKVMDWDWKQISTKYAEICFYKIKNLNKPDKNAPSLPDEVKTNIRGGEINERSEDVFNSDKLIKLLHLFV
jgi:hypothetical protein